MKKCLPFKLDNPISTECWTHNYLGVLMVHDQYRPFIMETFLSFYFDGAKVFLGSIDQPTTLPGFANEVLYCESLYTQDKSIEEAIKESICNNRYVLMFCDLSKENRPFMHEILLVGVDEGQNEIYYVRNDSSEILSMSLPDLLKAHQRYLDAVSHTDAFILSYHYKGPISTLFCNTGDHPRYPKIEIMKDRLYRHLCGCKSTEFFEEEAQSRTMIYGLPVYDCLCEQWKSRALPTAFWLCNNYKKLWESRRLLLMSIEELSRYPKLNIRQELVQKAQCLCEELDTAANMVIKYTISCQEALIDRIIEKTAVCRTLDAAVSSELYFCILDGLQAMDWFRSDNNSVEEEREERT